MPINEIERVWPSKWDGRVIAPEMTYHDAQQLELFLRQVVNAWRIPAPLGESLETVQENLRKELRDARRHKATQASFALEESQQASA